MLSWRKANGSPRPQGLGSSKRIQDRARYGNQGSILFEYTSVKGDRK
jgi:hypothetical protein